MNRLLTALTLLASRFATVGLSAFWLAAACTSAEAPPAETAPAAKVSKGPVFPAFVGAMPQAPAVPIEFIEGMDPYYRQLTLVDLKVPNALARAGHWGDSIIAADGLTSKIRSLMQERFGNGGHGFHIASRYNTAYLHRGIRFSSDKWASCLIITRCRKNDHYGYGAVASDSSGGALSRWWTPESGEGSGISRVELWFAEQPEGGWLQATLDDGEPIVIDTNADTFRDGWKAFDTTPGAHHFKVSALGNGATRVYGATFETHGPGVVWDELSMIGSFTQRLDYQDPNHIKTQLQHRQINLIVFLLGGNDTLRHNQDLSPSRPMTPYRDEYTAVLKKFHGARPEASCLVMSVTDHADSVSPGVVKTRSVVPRMVEVQREVAKEQGCAFFNTFEAMGGEGSIYRWSRKKPAWANGDYAHLVTLGQEAVAQYLVDAILHGYANYRRANEGRPLPELAALESTAKIIPARISP
jgi:lysophospholipase L1-like esterase